MGNKEYQIMPIIESQIPSAGALLADAFFNDTFNSYIFPDPQQRAQVLPWYFTASVREGAFLKGVYTTVGIVNGVAVCAPPHAGKRTAERAKQSGLDQTSIRFGPEAYGRFMNLIDYLARLSQKVVPYPHWYLSLLGVSPIYQGKGIGGALLAPVLQQADREGMPCYLETFEHKNIAFYQRYGFRPIATDTEPQSQLPFWAMEREPHPLL